MITSQLPGAKVIWGIDFDSSIEDTIQVVIIATKTVANAKKKFTAEQGNNDSENKNDGAGDETVSENETETGDTENGGADEVKNDTADKNSKNGNTLPGWLFTDEEFAQIQTVVDQSKKK